MLLPYKLTSGLFEAYSAVNVKLFALPVAFNVTAASDGVYCVDINGIMARNLNSIFACKVTGKNKACIFELDYGPFSYSQKVIDSGNSSDELKNLVNALYWYWYYGYRN